MSMKINTATSLVAETIFPQTVFSGKIEISDKQIKDLLIEISRLELHKYNWGLSGWNEDPDQVWNMTPKIQSVAPLIVKQCHDALTNQYNLPSVGNSIYVGNNQHYLEMRRCFPIILHAGHDYPFAVGPHFFSGITILNCTENGHKVYTRNLGRRLFFQDKMKFWMPENKQQLFLPSTVDWGISAGHDNSQTIALVSHIIMNKR